MNTVVQTAVNVLTAPLKAPGNIVQGIFEGLGSLFKVRLAETTVDAAVNEEGKAKTKVVSTPSGTGADDGQQPQATDTAPESESVTPEGDTSGGGAEEAPATPAPAPAPAPEGDSGGGAPQDGGSGGGAPESGQ